MFQFQIPILPFEHTLYALQLFLIFFIYKLQCSKIFLWLFVNYTRHFVTVNLNFIFLFEVFCEVIASWIRNKTDKLHWRLVKSMQPQILSRLQEPQIQRHMRDLHSPIILKPKTSIKNQSSCDKSSQYQHCLLPTWYSYNLSPKLIQGHKWHPKARQQWQRSNRYEH